MASCGSSETTSERKTWTSCFFCSFPITNSSSSEENEESGGNKSLDDHPPPLHSDQDDDQVSKKKARKDILFEYFLCGCKDKELEDNLTSPRFQLELCEICERRADDIQQLDLQLKTIKGKLRDKIKEVERIIIGNSSRATRSHRLFASFRTFLREKEETQVDKQLTFPEETQHPVDEHHDDQCCLKVEQDLQDDGNEDSLDKLEKVESVVKEEVEMEEADNNNDDDDDAYIEQDNSNTPTISNVVKKVKTCSAPSSRKKNNKCNICHEKFDGGSAVLRHKIRVHNHPKLKCELCPPPGKSYMDRQSLRQHHLRYHSSQESKKVKLKNKSRLVIDSSDDECGDTQPEQQCEFCTETFNKYSNFIIHCRLKHPSTSLKCSLCRPNSEEAALLSPLDELPRHLDEAHGISDLRLTCDFPSCGKIFYLKKRLDKHREYHHKKSRRCKKCKEVFPSNSELKAHNATVHFVFVRTQRQQTKKEYTCDMCSISYPSWDSRLNHLIVNHGHPKLKCELCPPSPGTFFNCHSTLSAHRKRHHPAEGKDNFPCSKCLKQFRTKNLKDIHEKIHVTTKDFSCDQCGYASKRKQNLTMHIQRMHAASKRFCCHICGYSTTMSSDLVHHMKNHDPQFECPECGKMFARQCNLTAHMHVHDSEPTFQCDLCHQVFKHDSGLRRHQRKKHASNATNESSRKRNQSFSVPIC